MTPGSRQSLFRTIRNAVQRRSTGLLSSEQNHVGSSKAFVMKNPDDGAELMLARLLIFDVLCATELQSIIAAARHDPDIGPDRLMNNAQCLIQSFTHNLLQEVMDQNGRRSFAALARALASHRVRFAFDSERDSLSRAQRAAESRTPITLYEFSFEDVTQQKFEVVNIEDQILSSNAYCTYKKNLLGFAHQSYEMRILKSLSMAGGVIDSSGTGLNEKSTVAVAQEISWTPTTKFTWSHGKGLSVVDRLKGFVEDSMGETWNWWPLRPRVRRLSDGFCRLSWQTVCPLTLNFQG